MHNDDDEVHDACVTGPDSPVPAVFVSPVPLDEPIHPVGKATILRSAITNNYSRPVHPTLPSEESPADLEDRKRRVLERNGRSNHFRRLQAIDVLHRFTGKAHVGRHTTPWLAEKGQAAELAFDDLERQQGINEKEEVKSELVLAIYEVGQCIFHGWGVVKDQKMAVSYYTTAARLGDPDAQSDLALCLANGKGCKKDRKEAARWYRKAVAQGQSDIGLAWIYKEKFQ